MGQLDEELGEQWASARAQWPGVELDRERFVEHARHHVSAAGGEPSEALGKIHTADLYLACACAEGNSAAIRAFEDSVMSGTQGPVRALDSQSAFVDEVVQRVRTKLLVGDGSKAPRIAEYAGRGPLVAWVTVTAVRTGLSLLRETNRANRFTDEAWAAALALPDTGDAELDYLKHRYSREFAQALAQACQQLPDRDRSVMRLYFLDGLNIDQIGKIYGVHRATIARWIAKSRDALFTASRDILVQELDVPASELTSLDRLVRSQLDVSLGNLLQTPPGPEAGSG